MTKGRVAFVVAVVVAVSALNATVLPVVVPDFLGIDFAVFGRTLSSPIAELYADTGPMPFIYPPTSILPFMAVGWLPYAAFASLSAIAFFAAVAAVCDRKVAALSLLSRAAFKGLQLGQIPMLLAAALFVSLRLAPFAGGLIWGAVAAIKPQLMIFAPVALVVRRDWQMLAGMAAGAGVSLAASLLAFGFEPWPAWHAAISAFAERALLEGAASKAVTPAGIALASGLPAWPFLVLGGLFASLAIVTACRHLRGAEFIALVVAASVAVSPYGYAHDTIAIIPACVIYMLRARWSYAVAGAFVFFGTPIMAMVGLLSLLALFAMDGLRTPRTTAEFPQLCTPRYRPNCPNRLDRQTRQPQ